MLEKKDVIINMLNKIEFLIDGKEIKQRNKKHLVAELNRKIQNREDKKITIRARQKKYRILPINIYKGPEGIRKAIGYSRTIFRKIPISPRN